MLRTIIDNQLLNSVFVRGFLAFAESDEVRDRINSLEWLIGAADQLDAGIASSGSGCRGACNEICNPSSLTTLDTVVRV